MLEFLTGSFEYERKQIYDGKDLMELNSLYAENEDISAKLKSLVPKVHQKILSARKGHTGSQEAVTVTNQLGNIKFKADVQTLTSLEQLVEIMKKAAEEKVQIKAVGTFSSFSSIAETNGYFLETSKYSGVSRTDVNLLRQEKESITYYDVLCGTTLNALIENLKKEGKALFNLDGWDGQSLVGLNATSTHGSGVTLQPLCDCVMSVEMVVPGGQLYRIEPTNGITDATKFSSRNPNIILIQDDKTFNACVVHVGSLGVTHSLTIAAQPIYSIIEIREQTTWTEAKYILRHRPYDTNPYLNNRNFEIWISPYTDYALVTKRNLATKEDEQKYPKSEAKALFQEFLQLPIVNDVAKMLNLDLGGGLFLLLHLFPATVPFLIETAVKTQYHKEPVVDIYNNIYILSSGANDFKVIAVEFSFSTKDDMHIKATDAILEKLKELRTKHNLNINGPASMRFSAASSQHLSMAHDEDMNTPRAYIEMPILLYHPEVDYYKYVYDPLVAVALQYGGRCHWGQYISDDLDNKYLTNAYPAGAIAAFIEQTKKFDPEGLMGNKLLRKLGLSSNGKLSVKKNERDIMGRVEN